MAILIDTNILVAYFAPVDIRHSSARRFLRELVGERRLIAAPVLNEVFYLLTERASYRTAIDSLRVITQAFPIIQLEAQDYKRIIAIMQKYEDAKFDYTDAAIMAVSERMNVSRIATFDRRDFEIYRPTHIPIYELLPNV